MFLVVLIDQKVLAFVHRDNKSCIQTPIHYKIIILYRFIKVTNKCLYEN